jgi:hypothetical protein
MNAGSVKRRTKPRNETKSGPKNSQRSVPATSRDLPASLLKMLPNCWTTRHECHHLAAVAHIYAGNQRVSYRWSIRHRVVPLGLRLKVPSIKGKFTRLQSVSTPKVLSVHVAIRKIGPSIDIKALYPNRIGRHGPWGARCFPSDGAVPARCTGGCRKVRWSWRGMGKSGGVRVIYFRKLTASIYLLMIYAKNVRDTVTGKELKKLKDVNI